MPQAPPSKPGSVGGSASNSKTDQTSINPNPGNFGSAKEGAHGHHAAKPVNAKPKPKPKPVSSATKSSDKPLILYAYAESEATRDNLKFFLDQGLHAAADFVFILIGETNVTDLIPADKANVRVVSRPQTCSDLGAYGEVLRKDGLWKKYKRFITMNASIRGPFLPYWSNACWSDLYLDRLSDKVKVSLERPQFWGRNR
jgi:hypothetical protein